ncbi:hypothetical protein [Streptomyces nigrescens]
MTAHRFHLTYLCGGALLVAAGGPGRQGIAGPPTMLLLGVLAVTIPLFLLQAGLQRADPMVAMVLLTTLPGATYLAETVFHGGFDATSLALICCLIAVAPWYARLSRRGATGGRSRAVQPEVRNGSVSVAHFWKRGLPGRPGAGQPPAGVPSGHTD